MVLPTDSPALRPFWGSVSRGVVIVAALLAVLHLAPALVAHERAPVGWEATGNVHPSPDMLLYRHWLYTPQLLQSNTFTSEANPPHLPALSYWAIGSLAQLAGWSPDWTYQVAGSVFAFVFFVLLWAVVNQFVPDSRQAWWTCALIVFGGGLGGWLRWLASRGMLPLEWVARLDVDHPFEDYRGHYVYVTLFDTHFLLLWTLMLAFVAAVWRTLVRFSVVGVLLAGVIGGALTWVHVYEAPTLCVFVTMLLATSWRDRALRPAALKIWVVTGAMIGACAIAWWTVYRRGGLPALPRGESDYIPVWVVLLAYPLVWLALPFGAARWWRSGGPAVALLAAWALGGLALTLAGPLYPFPSRGTLTLLIPLMIIAAQVWFARRATLSWPAIAACALVCGAGPLWELRGWKNRTGFDPAHDAPRPTFFMSPAHRLVINDLAAATADDVLLCDLDDAQWLGVEYRGRFWLGYWFLTVDRDAKTAAWKRFLAPGTPPAEQSAWLAAVNAKYLWVRTAADAARVRTLPELTLVRATPYGSLFVRKAAP